MRTDDKLPSSLRRDKEWQYELGQVDRGVEYGRTVPGPPGGPIFLSSSFSGHERNRLFLNREGKQFSDISTVSGLDNISDSRSFVLWDYDRDGWQDIALVNANAPLLNLYHNEIGKRTTKELEATNQIIALRFIGGNKIAEPSKEYSSRDGYGTFVSVSLGDLNIKREYRCGEGFAAQNSSTMIIGIGNRRKVEAITVRWPSGKSQSIENLPAGTLITVYENEKESKTSRGFVSEPYSTNSEVAVLPADFQRDPEKSMTLELKSLKSSQEQIPKLRMITSMATWCAACKKELPQLSYLRSAYSPSELQMVGVPIDPKDDSKRLEDYKVQYNPKYELLMNLIPDERETLKKTVKEALKIEALPSTVITDGNGKVLKVFLGVPTQSELNQLLD